MHDIDRRLFEAEAETFGETYGETYAETYGEEREQELVTGLLEVTTEAEFDRFLGDLLSGAVSAARDFARSDVGRAVGGVVKSAAKQALPQLGQLAGDFVRPGRGGALGRKAGEWVGNRLETGLQTEGLSAEDREYETAQAFVRFAQETAEQAASAAGTAPPGAVAQRAALASAQRHLPGLLRPPPSTPGQQAPAAEGRWVRRGNHIVVIGA
jgi:hypothetical protein